MGYSLEHLADLVKGYVQGDKACEVSSVATLASAAKGQISFLTNSKYRKGLTQTQASAVILTKSDAEECATNAIVVENPHAAYAKIATLLYQSTDSNKGIHPSAVVAESANIHAEASIGPNCVIEEGVNIGRAVRLGPGCIVRKQSTIGDNTELVAGVIINHQCQIGANVLLHPGVVIGADGFGQAYDEGQWLKVPQIGRVIIEDDVEVGANTTIDRGAIEDTVIGKGVKLDNLIQVAHNVHIGEHTVIASCTAIAGSTKIGKHCTIGGCVGIVGHLDITDNVFITGMSMITKSITKPGSYSSGLPAEETAVWHKNIVRFRQLDKFTGRLKLVERQLEEKKDND